MKVEFEPLACTKCVEIYKKNRLCDERWWYKLKWDTKYSGVQKSKSRITCNAKYEKYTFLLGVQRTY